jgi:hypothetical protein
MNRRIASFALVAGWAALGLTCPPARADSGQLSPERLDKLDQLGYFTPAFKAAVHDLVESKQALAQAQRDQARFTADLPDLQKQATDAQAQMSALRQELARYDHPEENDFAALQQRMNDPAAKPEDQVILAQAYVWTYPASPHQTDAQQYLQQLQKKMADDRQAAQEAEAARVAARASLVKRAQARQLSLPEWRDFLRGMSQDDLVNFLGPPTAQTDGYWIYGGAWIVDPVTRKKVGMEMNFDAGRVLTVDEKPAQP